eukprot:m51a1_g8514 hypothetical protein (727) ;mRNA; f:84480-86837
MSSAPRDLSVDEMNELRKKLGLAPLNDAPGAAPGASASAEPLSTHEYIEGPPPPKEKTAKQIKEEREAELEEDQYVSQRAKLAARPSLGSAGASDDAAAWVQRSRQLSAQQQREGEQQPQPQPQEGRQKRGRRHTERDLRGVKVAHDAEAIAEGAEVVLTLRDADVLDDEAGDVLENAALAEADRRRAHALAAKPPADDKYGDWEFEQLAAAGPAAPAARPLLTKYDSRDAGPRGFVIGGAAAAAAAAGDEDDPKALAERVRQRLRRRAEEAAAAAALPTVYDLSTTPTGAPGVAVAREFLTPQEAAAAFRRPARAGKAGGSKRVRRRPAAEAERPLSEVLQPLPGQEGTGADHAARGEREGAQGSMQAEMAERKLEYQRALDKARVDPGIIQRGKQAAVLEEDDDAELYRSLALARERKARQTAEEHEKAVAALVAAKREHRAEGGAAAEEEGGLVLTQTSEFVRAIVPVEEQQQQQQQPEPQEDEGAEGAAKEGGAPPGLVAVKAEGAEEEDTRMSDPDKEEEGADKGQGGAGGGEESEEEGLGIMEEPLVSQGLGAALRVLQSRGGLDALRPSMEVVVGRSKDKLNRVPLKDDPAPELKLEYLDAEGRPLTAKEAFRQMSHRFHGREPGKRKQEKLQKRIEEDLKRKTASQTDTPLNAVAALQKVQEQTKSAYVVLTGPGAKEPLVVDPKRKAEAPAPGQSAKKRARLAATPPPPPGQVTVDK